MTVGEELQQSETIANALDAIVREIDEKRAQLTGVRAPNPGLKETLDDHLTRVTSSRGRGLYAPYIGSGVGNGALVELIDGSVKYDMACGIGPHFFGHSDPDLVATAIRAAAGDVTMQGYFQQNTSAITFTETLVRCASRNSKLRHAFLCNSGAMANDNALKVVYQKNHPADRVIAFADCFMGRSVAMCQIGDNAAYRDGVPTTIGVEYVPFFNEVSARSASAGDISGQTRHIDMCVRRLEEHINRYPGKYAAFCFELIQGEGGYNTAPREFFTALMDVCKANSIAVWTDEIQTFGRTLEMFAFDALNLGEYVDMCTIGKMSQVCAAIFTEEYNPRGGLLSGTFLGSSVGLAVGQRMIERLEAGDYYGQSGRIAQHHRAFVEQVKGLVVKHPEWFPESEKVTAPYGGMGGMMRFTPFGGKKDKIMALTKALFDEGMVAIACGHDPYHVRILAPLGVMEESHWPRIFEVMERGLAKVAG